MEEMIGEEVIDETDFLEIARVRRCLVLSTDIIVETLHSYEASEHSSSASRVVAQTLCCHAVMACLSCRATSTHLFFATGRCPSPSCKQRRRTRCRIQRIIGTSHRKPLALILCSTESRHSYLLDQPSALWDIDDDGARYHGPSWSNTLTRLSAMLARCHNNGCLLLVYVIPIPDYLALHV